MASDTLEAKVDSLLTSLELGGAGFLFEPLPTSGNNRVFTLNCDGKILILKWYFYDALDSRERLGTEYSFLEHAWNMGLRCIPEPIGKNLDSNLALYEFVEGHKLRADQISEDVVMQAAKFLALLNSPKSRALGASLPNASEACFSVAEHFAVIDARLNRLAAMPIEIDLDRDALEFVSQLTKYWCENKKSLLEGCKKSGLNDSDVLQISKRCLSPSDFGFHNALMKSDGRLCFIDFEYAGWDDPAKTVGDFFSHPGVAVPRNQYEYFLTEALAPFEGAQNMAVRIRLLEPIFQVKWCCIMLNEFLPDHARRRNFASPSADKIARKQQQLHKAKIFYKTLHK